MKNEVYDCIVVGAGPAGVQAAIYLVRAGKKVCVFFDENKGALLQAEKIENYYAVNIMSGLEMYRFGIDQISNLGAHIINSAVIGVVIDYDKSQFEIQTANNSYNAKSLILAMGKEVVKPLEYEVEAKNGISYCALCDGFFYKNKKLAVIGSTNYTFNEYKHLKDISDMVTIFTNKKEIEFENINGLDIINEKILKVVNNESGNVSIITENKEWKFDGVFIADTHFNSNAISKTLGVEINSFSDIVVDENMKTNIPGIYACGDIVGGVKQISKCVNDGRIAGLSVINYLNNLKKYK